MFRLNEIKIRVNKSYLKIDTIKKVCNGINSSIYKVRFTNGSISAMKLYPKMNIKSIDRQGNESRMINLMRENGICNCPKILYTDKEYNFSLLSWIDGNKILSPTPDDLAKVCEFTKTLNNKIMLENSKAILQIASEAYFSIKEIINNIKKKLKDKENVFLMFEESACKEWLLNSIVKESFQTIDELIFSNSKYISEAILPNERKIISQSDVGFHNILKKEKELYFIDFEYGGWDNPYKTLSDWILQPDCNFTFSKELAFYDKLATALGLDIAWQNDIYIYLELYRIRWMLIISNKFTRDQDIGKERNKDILIKLKNYHFRSRRYLDNVRYILNRA